MAIKVNVSDQEDKSGGDYVPLPSGTYNCVITEVEPKSSQSDNNYGKPMLYFYLTVQDGKFAERVMGVNACCWDGALYTIINILKAIGEYENCKGPSGLEIPDEPEFYLGRPIKARRGINPKKKKENPEDDPSSWIEIRGFSRAEDVAGGGKAAGGGRGGGGGGAAPSCTRRVMPGFRAIFDIAFGPTTGYLCMASRRPQGQFTERFFSWPEEADQALAFFQSKMLLENVYFCPQLFKTKKRSKENIGEVASVWADLDDCQPELLKVAPTLTIETSPGRWQALWSLDKPVAPEDAEATSRRIAYGHFEEGSDKSGWDLTQLLRVPGTFNHKPVYATEEGPPRVRLRLFDSSRVYKLVDFRVYPQVAGYEYLDVPFPEFILEKGEEILERYRFRINGAAFTAFHRVDETKDRSSRLFLLEMYCLEAGMQLSEVFQVCRDSVVNKFDKDEILLWKDICRAKARFDDNLRVSTSQPTDEISLLSDTEKEIVNGLPPTFVDRYISWAKSVGDAAEQYHVAGAFVCLSSVLAGSVQLPTSFGTVAPNLWFMLLADTTLTRKSTAMELAMDLVMEADEDTLMATDGSLEGMMTALAARDNIPSVFMRDEFTALMDQMHKKDYMAGMPEFLAKLYDGKPQKRLLRKEEIKVKRPRLIIFAGGIKSKMMRIVHHEHVESGFLPRF